MKTIKVSNISLFFDSEETMDSKAYALKYIDFLNELLMQLNLPEFPQLMVLENELEVQEEDWEKNGWK